jgi:hypothetical protein
LHSGKSRAHERDSAASVAAQGLEPPIGPPRTTRVSESRGGDAAQSHEFEVPGILQNQRVQDPGCGCPSADRPKGLRPQLTNRRRCGFGWRPLLQPLVQRGSDLLLCLVMTVSAKFLRSPKEDTA